MRLRIISGILKGRFIKLPDSGMKFRPTLERTRQSIAEIIKSYLPDAIAADVCAGSGAFGFEMISRGALRVDFIEKDRKRSEMLITNSQILGISQNCRFIADDVRSFISRSREKYDVIFYDPPYAEKCLQSLIPDLLKIVKDNGILVYERQAKQHSNISDKGTAPFDVRTFGDTVVEIYQSR